MGTTGGTAGYRVGDEERHHCAELLREHYAYGRLTEDEFTERLGAALTARRTGDLGRLLADLPSHTSGGNPGTSTHQAAARKPWTVRIDLRDLARSSAPWATVVIASLIAMAITEGQDHQAIALVLIFSLIVGAIGVIAGRLSSRHDIHGRRRLTRRSTGHR
ncbi:DUF1707 SHOCT-like domain-containing protein [Actinopolymorpha pittospori]|uniref:DUF1707 domain-containing protein n=1 Tax=Actinopolymorpha pittospori TaxID=648752 RepID=A0A927N746_9ACTN|nr:hypothetical protein [Actinopolymorpha pittospori]